MVQGVLKVNNFYFIPQEERKKQQARWKRNKKIKQHNDHTHKKNHAWVNYIIMSIAVKSKIAFSSSYQLLQIQTNDMTYPLNKREDKYIDTDF